MELFDIYNRDRINTGKTVIRGNPFSEEEYHMVVHVCIFNSMGEMLIQQRQSFKKGWPGMWDVTAGGSAIAGESSRVAAERELFEEIGYQIDLSHKRPHLTVNFKEGFDDYYLVENEVDTDKLKLQFEEVQKVKWASKDEILSMIDNGEFIPFHKSLMELFFNMRKYFGAVREAE
ncbi:MAG TPA: NUDIX domain-containing protein [Clostridia bacterium]|nr:NUDIX domain-containing protein [Clostridia bacterium]